MNLADNKADNNEDRGGACRTFHPACAAVIIRLTYADEALGLPPVDPVRGPLPVALLELTRWQQVIDPSSTAMRAQNVEEAVAVGLPRWTGVDAPVLRRHPGWSLFARANRVELHGPRGSWARGSDDVSPDWRVASMGFGSCALALFGPILGVRAPTATWEAEFTQEKRRADLLAAASAGLVAGALIQCRLYQG
jgi:hypothetical protein